MIRDPQTIRRRSTIKKTAIREKSAISNNPIKYFVFFLTRDFIRQNVSFVWFYCTIVSNLYLNNVCDWRPMSLSEYTYIFVSFKDICISGLLVSFDTRLPTKYIFPRNRNFNFRFGLLYGFKAFQRLATAHNL